MKSRRRSAPRSTPSGKATKSTPPASSPHPGRCIRSGDRLGPTPASGSAGGGRAFSEQAYPTPAGICRGRVGERMRGYTSHSASSPLSFPGTFFARAATARPRRRPSLPAKPAEKTAKTESSEPNHRRPRTAAETQPQTPSALSYFQAHNCLDNVASLDLQSAQS